MMLSCLLVTTLLTEPPTIRIDRDNVDIRQTCTIVIAAEWINDADDNGVIHITGDNITVDFAGQKLHGAPPGRAPDRFYGCGVRITGKDVTLRAARVSGFKAAIWATGADGLMIEDCDVSGNFRQRLRSTPRAEDPSDWLRPHENDNNEWLTKWGAGIYVEESQRITVRRNRARRGQNGLCLRRVNDSQIYDNDFSFLSGWGIALFRCSNNVIARNSCDFCVRGYSHGVYARGQDSAGILMFEQCRENVVAENSATHGGDGFFGFAGKQALEADLKEPRVGCNRNFLCRNDFSYAVANSIEMTFSFFNIFADNVLSGSNYGIWGGYSSYTRAYHNTIADNLTAGLAVEHGAGWQIDANTFRNNRRGVQLWWDDDKDLLAKPWARLNNTDSKNHRIIGNTFAGDRVGVELRGGSTGIIILDNEWQDVENKFDCDPASTRQDNPVLVRPGTFSYERVKGLPGRRRAVGARRNLAGRDKIIMTEWGPYDWDEGAPYLQRIDDQPGAHVYRLLGKDAIESASADEAVSIDVRTDGPHPRVVVAARQKGTVCPYELTVRAAGRTFTRRETLVATEWNVRVFAYRSDPREDLQAWLRQAADHVAFTLPQLSLRYGTGGPSRLAGLDPKVAEAKLPADSFGTIATTTLTIPAGRWRLTAVSDDGIRVWVDRKLVIDNWTHHPPTVDTAELTFTETRQATIRVEHFELSGYATLALGFAAVAD